MKTKEAKKEVKKEVKTACAHSPTVKRAYLIQICAVITAQTMP